MVLARVSTHSRPKAAAQFEQACALAVQFQLTAARRRLPSLPISNGRPLAVSTHSRPKAAANGSTMLVTEIVSFNSQPPEGGCMNQMALLSEAIGFNSQPPEGGCLLRKKP